MTLLINNAEVEKVLTMAATIDALEASYRRLAEGEATCRPRIDISIPTSDPSRTYRWGTMEGGATNGYFALRLKSDVVYREERGGTVYVIWAGAGLRHTQDVFVAALDRNLDPLLGIGRVQ